MPLVEKVIRQGRLESKNNHKNRNRMSARVSLVACRWEAWTPIVGAVVTILIFVALPAYFYQNKFNAIGNCGADITRYM